MKNTEIQKLIVETKAHNAAMKKISNDQYCQLKIDTAIAHDMNLFHIVSVVDSMVNDYMGDSKALYDN